MKLFEEGNPLNIVFKKTSKRIPKSCNCFLTWKSSKNTFLMQCLKFSKGAPSGVKLFEGEISSIIWGFFFFFSKEKIFSKFSLSQEHYLRGNYFRNRKLPSQWCVHFWICLGKPLENNENEVLPIIYITLKFGNRKKILVIFAHNTLHFNVTKM